MIREFRSEDLPVIMDIGNRAWRGIYAMYKERYGDELFSRITPAPATSKGEQIKTHSQKHPEWILVCEENGTIVGFITFMIDQKSMIGEIGNNAVDPQCTIKGIGQQMYQAVLEIFRSKNMTFAKVSTGLDDAHAPARRAYKRAGFNISAENVTYFQKI